METKVYLDEEGLALYDELIKLYIQSHVADANVEAEAERAQAAEQELYKQLVAIGTDRIKPLEDKVDSLAKMLDLLTVDAPEAFNTLKEIADWIKQDETATASLIQTVSEKADKSYVDEKYAQITSINESNIEALF